MKKAKFVYFPVLMFFFLFSDISLAKLNPTNQPANIDYVFIQTAPNGRITYDSNTDTYHLSLYEVEPWVTYMSSSPKKRVTGFMSIDKFITAWQSEANKNPQQEMLNSAIVAVEKGNNKDEIIHFAIAVKNPIYSPQNNTIDYTIKSLQGPQQYSIPKDADFKHIALFIDDVCVSCVGRIF